MTDEEISDFMLLSPAVALVDFVRNKEGFRQIAHRVRELSSVPELERIDAFSMACLVMGVEKNQGLS